MSRTVLVPIDLEALVLDEPLTPPRHDGAPFTDDGAPLDAGVHVSWALPDGLTRGTHESDGRLRYPTVPDRWLVVRFGPESLPDGRRTATAFLVDAWHGTRSNLGPSSPTPFPPPEPRARLTAAGTLEEGELRAETAPDGWSLAAGYYGASRGRFGFHDTPDLTLGTVSYVVVGWYGSADEDPVLSELSLSILGHLDLRLEGPSLSVARPVAIDPDKPGRPPPVAVVRPAAERQWALHATALHHDGPVSEEDRARAAEALIERLRADDERFLGELPERLGASRDGGAQRAVVERAGARGAERLAITSRALEGIPQLTRPAVYAIPQAEVGLVCHGALFDVGEGSFGQRAWRHHEKALGGSNHGTASLHPTLGAALDSALEGSVAKESRDFLQAMLAGQGTQLLRGGSQRAAADAIYDAGFRSEPSPATVAWSAVVRDVGDAKAKPSLPDPAAGVTMFVRDLRTKPGKPLPLGVDAKDLGKLRADASPGAAVSVETFEDPPPRWYQPAAPTVLVKNAGRTFRFGYDARFAVDGHLGARTPAGLVAAQTILPLGGPARVVGADDLVDLSPLPTWLPGPVRDLVREAAVLDPLGTARADTLAGVSPGSPAADVARTFGPGKPPTGFAAKRWRQPFVPLFVEARYTYQSASGAVSTGSERALLGPASEALADSLRSLARSIGTGPESAGLTTAAAAVQNLDLLTAALPGVGPMLSTQGQIVREGALTLTELRIVDVFGQVRDEAPDPSAATAALPRSFAVPARLACRFVDASLDLDAAAADAGPTVSPVVGFLLTDPLENAIEVFDHEGRPLGQLRHSVPEDAAAGQRIHVVAEGPPGAATGLSANLAGARPALRQLVSALRDFPVAPLDQDTSASAFTRVVDITRFLVDGATSSTYREALLGRPIVLLRTRLNLERGVPGPAGTTKGPATGPRLQAKVNLGCISRTDDGLIGYWLGSRVNGLTTWSRFRTIEPPLTPREAFPESVLQGDQREAVWMLGDIRSGYVEIARDATRPDLTEGSALELVLALDGRLGFTVACDELPSKHLRPLEAFGGATMKKLAPSFRVGPVLIDPAAFSLPAPALEAEHPTWIRVAAPGEAEVPLTGYAEARLALPNKRMRVEDEGAIRLDPGVQKAPETP